MASLYLFSYLCTDVYTVLSIHLRYILYIVPTVFFFVFTFEFGFLVHLTEIMNKFCVVSVFTRISTMLCDYNEMGTPGLAL